MGFQVADEALHLAGLALAHALWNASDLASDEFLVPLAFFVDGEETKLLRFEAATQQEAIDMGRERMAALTSRGIAWAFARDGILRENDVPVDVIAVDAWAPTSEGEVTVVQRYIPFAASQHFSLIGPMDLFVGEFLAPNASSALSAVEEGMQLHKLAAELIPRWRKAPDFNFEPQHRR